MPPWTCTPSEAASSPMSDEKALAIGVSRPRLRSPSMARKIKRGGGQVTDAARRLHVRLHRHQHALNVGVLDDRRHAVAAFRAAALAPLAGEGDRLLVSALADANPLRPDREPRGVHHHEHGGESAVLFADKPGLGAFVLA